MKTKSDKLIPKCLGICDRKIVDSPSGKLLVCYGCKRIIMEIK